MAPTAKLPDLHPVGVELLVLHGVIVPALALSARQRNLLANLRASMFRIGGAFSPALFSARDRD